jgi:probable sporulation protein (polysaccharide deacetylase family)
MYKKVSFCMVRKLVFVLVSLGVAAFAFSSMEALDTYIRETERLVSANRTDTAADRPNAAALRADGKSSAEETMWRQRILEEAEKRRIPPVDARIDPIWKAIPGYNGLEVDVDASLAQTLRSKELKLVFREVPPRIVLDDLGPQPIYKGNPNKRMVALMINVAWGNEHIPGMLEALREEKVKATFFFDGSWLRKNTDLARQIASDGHELSNHAYSHPNMSELTRQQASEEIAKTEKLLEETFGVRNRWFAPPSGDYSQETVQIAYEHGLKTVLWTLDTVDWKRPSPDWIVRRVTDRLEPGALILMHPTEPTRIALPTLIREIKRRGFALGTVSDTLSMDRLDTETAGDGGGKTDDKM